MCRVNPITSIIRSVLLFQKIISVKLRDIIHRQQSENPTGSSQRQHGHGCGNINIPRVQISRAEGTNIDRIPLVKCALKIPEMRSAIDPFPSRHEPLDAVAKKKKPQSCSPPLKLLHSSSTSSAVEVVRQDQDEPGDVNLLLSPLTLAFAGGNTFPCRQSERRYLQTRTGARRSVHNICTTRDNRWHLILMYACKSQWVYRILAVGGNWMTAIQHFGRPE